MLLRKPRVEIAKSEEFIRLLPNKRLWAAAASTSEIRLNLGAQPWALYQRN